MAGWVVVAGSLVACSSPSPSASVETKVTVDVPVTLAGVGSLPPLGLLPMGLGGSANTFPNGESVPRQSSTVGDAAEGPRI
ncbi:MAG: hypothetical protein RIS41_1453, partial [Actinomycetota bacterium]